MTKNAAAARAMTSLATYELVVRKYWRARHSLIVRPFLRVWIHQARLKREEA
jgi:hypothetical protein